MMFETNPGELLDCVEITKKFPKFSEVWILPRASILFMAK